MERKGFYQKSLSRQLIVFIEPLYYRQQKLIINTVSNQTYIFKLTYIWIPSLISHQHLEKKEKKRKKNRKKEREYICKVNFPGEKLAFQSNFDMFLSSLCNL